MYELPMVLAPTQLHSLDTPLFLTDLLEGSHLCTDFGQLTYIQR